MRFSAEMGGGVGSLSGELELREELKRGPLLLLRTQATDNPQDPRPGR